ncbi:retrotransposon protein, putative, ty1-copia subclass [Tanacetum coccineum]
MRLSYIIASGIHWERRGLRSLYSTTNTKELLLSSIILRDPVLFEDVLFPKMLFFNQVLEKPKRMTVCNYCTYSSKIQELSSNPTDTIYGFMDRFRGRAKVVGCKWVFKIKTDMDGNVNTFKVILVAKGYTQTQGVDYYETFVPVVSTLVIRILFFIPEYYDYEIWQMDVKNAFLNGRLYEDVYMEQPEGVKAWLGICFAMKDLGEAAGNQDL